MQSTLSNIRGITTLFSLSLEGLRPNDYFFSTSEKQPIFAGIKRTVAPPKLCF